MVRPKTTTKSTTKATTTAAQVAPVVTEKVEGTTTEDNTKEAIVTEGVTAPEAQPKADDTEQPKAPIESGDEVTEGKSDEDTGTDDTKASGDLLPPEVNSGADVENGKVDGGATESKEEVQPPKIVIIIGDRMEEIANALDLNNNFTVEEHQYQKHRLCSTMCEIATLIRPENFSMVMGVVNDVFAKYNKDGGAFSTSRLRQNTNNLRLSNAQFQVSSWMFTLLEAIAAGGIESAKSSVSTKFVKKFLKDERVEIFEEYLGR